MMVDKSKFNYFFYMLIVIFSYILSVNIVSSEIKWIVNKFFYLCVLVFFISNFYKVVRVRKIELASISSLLLFLILFFLSNIENFGYHEAIINTISNGLLYFITFIVFLVAVKTYSIKSLLIPFSISSILIVLLSFLIFFGIKIPYYFDDQEALEMYISTKEASDIIGFSGVYLNQNSLSSTLVVAIISFFLLYSDSSSKFRKLLIVMILLSMALLLLTVSRAAIFSLFILFILYFIKGVRSKRNLILFFSFLGFLVLLGFYFIDFLNFLIMRIQNDGTSLRSIIWQDALSVFEKNFYFGVGDYRYETFNGSFSAHNVYIQKLVSNGFLGSFFWYFWILIGLLISLKNIFLLDFYNNKFMIFSSCSLVSILIHQCFESMIGNVFLPITLFLFLNISFNLLKISQPENKGV